MCSWLRCDKNGASMNYHPWCWLLSFKELLVERC
ncbi:hypothetical protein COLO4_33971 [Corchorus olitorius]|uniref:Uncharacterized protein n=1 Tax=Corchorus olitorius TaxID=93759 RepID=A0A1R3GPQ4_9ROSI|nr:hypothetical protein COLO4_33971 [Corchorus olitorius]